MATDPSIDSRIMRLACLLVALYGDEYSGIRAADLVGTALAARELDALTGKLRREVLR